MRRPGVGATQRLRRIWSLGTPTPRPPSPRPWGRRKPRGEDGGGRSNQRAGADGIERVGGARREEGRAERNRSTRAAVWRWAGARTRRGGVAKWRRRRQAEGRRDRVPGMSNGFLTGRDLGGDFSGGCLLGSRRTEKPVRSLPFSGSA